MARRNDTAPAKKRPVEQDDHKGRKRANNPPVGLVDSKSDAAEGRKTYAYDPHLEPTLVWAGKAERTSFEIPTVSLHVHERIDPRTIVEAVRKKNGSDCEQMSLFNSKAENPPLREAIEFYKRASNESFWLVGQPDVILRTVAAVCDRRSKKEQSGAHRPPLQYQVEVRGFDYYDTKTGQIVSGGAAQIAMWMLDTDYDGRSLFARQVLFPMAGEKEGWSKLARNLKAEIDEDLIEAYRGTLSLPFELRKHSRVAVKIVDDRGIESLKMMEVV
jgi:hypothetical protein